MPVHLGRNPIFHLLTLGNSICKAIFSSYMSPSYEKALSFYRMFTVSLNDFTQDINNIHKLIRKVYISSYLQIPRNSFHHFRSQEASLPSCLESEVDKLSLPTSLWTHRFRKKLILEIWQPEIHKLK